LIGRDWHARMQDPDDPVRMELEAAVAAGVPILPVLIGSTPMPRPQDLPASVAAIATQNAAVLGVLHDFDTHMRALLPQIESMLGGLVAGSIITREPHALGIACNGIVPFLQHTVPMGPVFVQWSVFGTRDFQQGPDSVVSLYLHRTSHLGDFVELHVLLSFWFQAADATHVIAGLVMQRIEQEPVVPASFLMQAGVPLQVKLRRSDEDPRQVWKMVTDLPLQLSLAYIATVSGPAPADETAPDPTAEDPETP
jgi:hypothetical protein